MTPQERQLLEDFLDRLAAVHGVQKDAQADALIRERLAQQPDAVYLLIQRSLLQDQALADARRQIAELQQPARQGDPGGASFLGHGLGTDFGRRAEPAAAPRGAGLPPPAPLPGESYGAQAAQRAPSWRERLFGGGPAAQAAPMAGGGGSFLGSAAAAAAGVAGGMFLYNGLEHLLGGNEAHAAAAGQGETPVVENITQNFYGDAADPGQASDGWDDAGADDQDFSDDDSFL